MRDIAKPARTPVEQEIVNLAAAHPEAKQTIIFAPGLPWDAKMFQRPQQLARALAHRGALVFYMQPERFWPAGFIEVEPRLIICQTSAEGFRVFPQAFVYVLTWNIPILAYFESPRVIYDYLDELSVFEGDYQRLKRDHTDYLMKAELVLATSERLYRQAVSLRADCLLCPNGVDVQHFADSSGAVPEDLAPILMAGKPIIGYHGALARWLDYDLLKTLAHSKPEYSFVLVGSDHDQTLNGSNLLALPNVHWLGPKSYAELPRYVNRFEIGLIPFIVSEITHAVSPIKLFEYFAAGKPVVASPMEESSRSKDVLVAATPEQWLEKIEQGRALARDVHYVEHLQAVSLQNSWDIRADSILKRLQTLNAAPRVLPWHTRLQPRSARFQQFLRLIGRAAKVWRMSGLRGVMKGAYYKFYGQYARLHRLFPFRRPRWLDDTYIPEDNSQVTLYTDNPAFLPDYFPRRELAPAESRHEAHVSLICSTYNERKYVSRWLEGTLSQSVLPDEIIIVDGGSTDGTFEMLSSHVGTSKVPLRVIKQKDANISQARNINIAIRTARYEIIAVTDCGCRLQKDWLKNLIAPFSLEPQTEVVAGWYQAVDEIGRSLPFKCRPSLAKVDPQSLIPASHSLAFTKEAWKKAGGYPEWLTQTGEDTFFVLELKRHCRHWAFVPSAVADWSGPKSWPELWKHAFTSSAGNGEVGYYAWFYRLIAKRLLGGVLSAVGAYLLIGFAIKAVAKVDAPLVWGGSALAAALLVLAVGSISMKVSPQAALGKLGLRISQIAGFWTGARRKGIADQRRLAQTKGLYFILAGVPIDDSGGGARPAQIALELLRQDYWVVYIHCYPRWETGNPVVRIAHPNLLTYILGEFRWEDFANRYGTLLSDRPISALIEFPFPGFLPLVREIAEREGQILYDMIDDWNTSFGNWGYSPSIEREMIRISKYLITTAPILKEKLETMSRRPALLLPNAVNTRLFNLDRFYERPADLPRADWIAIYTGALGEDRFDWDLLIAVANRYPLAAMVIVGDYRGQRDNLPPNLHFLGLKPQSSLPAYLAYSDVALIPWKVNRITQACSPLKLYGYLAMHRPVVAPDLMPLHDIPGVALAKSSNEFVQLVEKVRYLPMDIEQIDRFIGANNWQGRVEYMLESTGPKKR